MKHARIFWIGFICLLVNAAFAEPLSAQRIAAHFSAQEAGSLPAGWQARSFPKIETETLYVLVRDSERTVLKAESHASASALMTPFEIMAGNFPWLEWSWKIERVVPGVWGDKSKDDFSARLFVIFEKPKGPFSFFASFLGSLVGGGFSGNALNYVWASDTQAGQVLPSPYTGRVMMIAVRAGTENVGRWVTERRNVVKDYRQAFGKEPGEIVGLAIMTDTDNTGIDAVAYYGDIRFLADQGKAD